MSTKNSLQPVTKPELQQELKKYATKEDLKEALKKYATKDDLKKGFSKMNKKLDIIINFFDHEVLDHEKRITRLENHTGLAPLT